MSPKKILFVCLGNICRSPAADGVMNSRAHLLGLDVMIDSAGVGGWHIGQLPDRRMRECGARHGYMFDHRARQIVGTDFDDFDIVVGMDEGNMRDLHNLAPNADAEKKIVCLADFMTHHPAYSTIPDPYYGDEADFELALELIEDGVDGLIDTYWS